MGDSLQLEPIDALEQGRWFKLICGASYHHLPDIQALAAVYAAAGANCVDVAAEPAIVRAAQLGIEIAIATQAQLGKSLHRPWLMISINDGEDPHFRKAVFDAAACPPNCPRPCLPVCPTQAISFDAASSKERGVIASRCYGCGRCLALCPIGHIQSQPYVSTPELIAASLFSQVDAVEIHTQVGHLKQFQRLWHQLSPYLHQLRLVSVSCADSPHAVEYLWQVYHLVQPLGIPLLWQTDGRPMSGDIGLGTTHATIRYAQRVLQSGPPGFVQLAGGTNAQTVPKLRSMEMLTGPGRRDRYVSGVGYGSYARTLVAPHIALLEQRIAVSEKNKVAPLGTGDSAVSAALAAGASLPWRQSIHLAQTLVSQLQGQDTRSPSAPAACAPALDSSAMFPE